MATVGVDQDAFDDDAANFPALDRDLLTEGDDPVLRGEKVKLYRQDEPLGLWGSPVDCSILTAEESEEVDAAIRRCGSMMTAAHVFRYERAFGTGDPGLARRKGCGF